MNPPLRERGTRSRFARKHLRLLVIASALVLGGSCDGAPRTLTGVWIGYDGDRKVVLALNEENGAITGGGSIAAPPGQIEIDPSSRDGEDVTIQVSILYEGGYSFGFITGVFRDDRIIGTMTGLAFETKSITLTRYP